MDKIRVAMVSYLNSIPFKYGLNHKMEDAIEMMEEPPSICAELFFSKKVDVALLPIGALVGQSEYEIFSDSCIGSIGEVQTVSLFTNNELKDIRTVYLDSHSRSSALLTKLLFAENGYKNIEYITCETENLLLDIGEAKLMIGDKVFRNEFLFEKVIDLSVWWQELTGLPFVFAVWVRSKTLSDNISSQLSLALKYGVENKFESLKSVVVDVDLKSYFKHNISYSLDDSKKEALCLFFKKVKENNLV